MSVKRLLREVDSEEIAEWYAYDQRHPLPDSWAQTARMCRIIMAASGNYKKKDIPDEAVFIPTAVKAGQSHTQIINELMKLNQPRHG